MINSIGFALDPSNVPAFLLDWEITRKCNMDCSYCGTDENYGGHLKNATHPPLDECLKTIDFMYEYVDLYMSHKKPTQRKVVLNVYGGESLFHPGIVEILNTCREKHIKYADKWHLTVTTTTNAVVNKKIWNNVINLVDEFTVSYHAEQLPKESNLFFDNLLKLVNSNKRVKVVVLMHNNLQLWQKSLATIDFCIKNNIKWLAKALDNLDVTYTQEQYDYLKNIWVNQTKNSDQIAVPITLIKKDKITSIQEGRACCGGRGLSINNDLRSNVKFVPRQGFKDWYCSVNWFFLFVRQDLKEIYTNKDCRTSLNSKVEPLGYLTDCQKVLDELKNNLNNKTLPVIQCVKDTCWCGYCAPKAEKLTDFKELVSRHVISDVIKY